RSWSKLILLWCRMDKIMNNVYDYPKNLDRKLKVVSASIILLGVADYGLSVLNRYTNVAIKFGENYSPQKYFEETFPQLYRFMPFNIFTAIYCSVSICSFVLNAKQQSEKICCGTTILSRQVSRVV
ncbi:hypothetical protein NQ317_009671, partial [Molorchus minor]